MPVTGRDARSRVLRHRPVTRRERATRFVEPRPLPEPPERLSTFDEQPRRHPWASAYLARAAGADLAAVIGSVAAACLTAFGTAVPRDYVLLGVVVTLGWFAALALAGGYQVNQLGVSDDEYRAVGRAGVGVFTTFAAAALLGQWSIRPSFLVILFAGLLGLGLAGRWLARRWLRDQRAVGKLTQRTVVVGRADSAAALIRSIRKDHHQGLTPVAACVSGLDTGPDDASDLDGVPVLGQPEDTLTAVDLADADVVAVAADPDLSGVSLRRLTWALAERDVELIIAPGLLDVAGPRLTVRPSTDLTLLHVSPPEPTVATSIVKGLSDRALAGLLLVLLSPVLLATALAIKLSSPGPVFYRTRRVGVNGQPFQIVKFRTMVVGADQVKEQLASCDEGNGVLFKMRQDPRVTKLGRHLRRYSIDELPQLFNVLTGSMSLVGPRPPEEREVGRYEVDAMRRLRVRPGMTGLWQVSGRSDLDWEQTIRLDLRYVDNLCLTLDAHILVRTFKAVFGGGGAY